MKLAVMLGTALAALGTAITFSPTAVADPACPDVSNRASIAEAEQSFSQRYHNQRDPQAAIDWARFLSTCATQKPPTSVPQVQPYALPAQPKPVDSTAEDLAALRATGNTPAVDVGPDPSMDCAGMYDSINGADALNLAGGKFGERVPRLPLLSQVQAAPLAVCAAINAGINHVAPNPNAAEQASTGGCDAVQQFASPAVMPDMCGNDNTAH